MRRYNGWRPVFRTGWLGLRLLRAVKDDPNLLWIIYGKDAKKVLSMDPTIGRRILIMDAFLQSRKPIWLYGLPTFYRPFLPSHRSRC